MNGYIGLGSNMGDPIAELRAAVMELEKSSVTIQKHSSLYQTEPVGIDVATEPAWFVNAVLRVGFEGEPVDLLRLCLGVEKRRGRQRSIRNAPRRIDLDVLLVGDRIVTTPELTLPHPRLHQRRFVLEPMVEIDAQALHPVVGLTMQSLLASCPDASDVVRLADALTA